MGWYACGETARVDYVGMGGAATIDTSPSSSVYLARRAWLDESGIHERGLRAAFWHIWRSLDHWWLSHLREQRDDHNARQG